MSEPKYRLSIAASAKEMSHIATLIDKDYPDLAKAIGAQWLEILNSGVNIFEPYERQPSEPLAGLTDCEISLLTGIKD